MDWRLGGRAVRRWDDRVLLAATCGGGVALILGSLVARLGSPWSPTLSLAALWIGLLSAVAYAFGRARPAGLLRFRPQDVVWGLGLAVTLRIVEGATEPAGAPFPASATLRETPVLWLLQEGLPTGIFGPIAEEFFFRALVLVAVYQLCRRSIGKLPAAATALFVSAALFVGLHFAFAPMSLLAALHLFAVGVGCSLVVLLTGRVWGAVLAHSAYNLIFLLIVLAGTALS